MQRTLAYSALECPTQNSKQRLHAVPTLQLFALQARKELTKGNFRQLHWNWGSLLLGLGVVISIVGPINTYLRAGALLHFSATHFLLLERSFPSQSSLCGVRSLREAKRGSRLFSGWCVFAGKLFPGPHLYAGAGIVALWAVAASLVPAMQKGSEAARTLHITLNCVNIALFAWQVSHKSIYLHHQRIADTNQAHLSKADISTAAVLSSDRFWLMRAFACSRCACTFCMLVFHTSGLELICVVLQVPTGLEIVGKVLQFTTLP